MQNLGSAILPRLRQTVRGENAAAHVFELWIGLAGVISGIVFFYQPALIAQDAISVVIGRDAAATWIVSYMVAGALVWWGLLRPSPMWEAAGLWLLGGGTAANGIAIIDVFGWRGVPTAATVIALTAAAWLRALVVHADVLRLAEEYRQEQPGGHG
jgi:hypothetical protein